MIDKVKGIFKDNMRSFSTQVIRVINEIADEYTNLSCWTETFTVDNDLIVIARHNGYKFTGTIYIAVINVGNKSVNVDKKLCANVKDKSFEKYSDLPTTKTIFIHVIDKPSLDPDEFVSHIKLSIRKGARYELDSA